MSKGYFDQVAPYWEEMRHAFFTEAVRDKALEIAGVRKGAIAADVGAGTGFITEGLVSRGLQVIAVDQSDAMLAKMKEKFSGAPVDYRIGHSDSLPIADDSVDYAIANMYLHHVESPLAAIMEMVRILKAGGKLIITDLEVYDSAALKAKHQDRWMGFRTDLVLQWLAHAGLLEVAVAPIGERCCAHSTCESAGGGIPIFIASGTK